jgi:hypothetical protein
MQSPMQKYECSNQPMSMSVHVPPLKVLHTFIVMLIDVKKTGHRELAYLAEPAATEQTSATKLPNIAQTLVFSPFLSKPATSCEAEDAAAVLFDAAVPFSALSLSNSPGIHNPEPEPEPEPEPRFGGAGFNISPKIRWQEHSPFNPPRHSAAWVLVEVYRLILFRNSRCRTDFCTL